MPGCEAKRSRALDFLTEMQDRTSAELCAARAVAPSAASRSPSQWNETGIGREAESGRSA